MDFKKEEPERIIIVRVKPNIEPYLDEIEISSNNIYNFTLKFMGELYYNSIELDWRSPDLNYMPLEEDVVAICYNGVADEKDNKIYYELWELDKNRHLWGEDIYGDFIVIGIDTLKDEDNRFIGKYKSLSMKQVEKYIKKFKL